MKNTQQFSRRELLVCFLGAWDSSLTNRSELIFEKITDSTKLLSSAVDNCEQLFFVLIKFIYLLILSLYLSIYFLTFLIRT